MVLDQPPAAKPIKAMSSKATAPVQIAQVSRVSLSTSHILDRALTRAVRDDQHVV